MFEESVYFSVAVSVDGAALCRLHIQGPDCLICKANENFSVVTWRTAVVGPHLFEPETQMINGYGWKPGHREKSKIECGQVAVT